jgi:DNA invertase Pin-like site-specific DNA recombinase
MRKFISYRRVSTADQGKSGLGLEAQAAAIADYVQARGGAVIEDFEEVETGRGSNALEKRPKLREAMRAAKRQRATLVVAKLDRLSRNVHFVSGVMESGADFAVADLPRADKTMLHFYAMVAEWERDRISQRLKETLAAKKRRGEPVGNAATLQPFNGTRARDAADFAAKLRPTLRGYIAQGMTQRAMVDALNSAGTKTARGGEWSLVQLQRVLSRIAESRTRERQRKPA